MKEIFYKKKLTAILITSLVPGSNPITLPKESLQVLTLKRRKGDRVKAHFHKPQKRTSENLQECLLVRKGKIKVFFYGTDGQSFKNLSMKTGDILIVLTGGISIEFLEDTEIIEIKNGPFIDDKVLI